MPLITYVLLLFDSLTCHPSHWDNNLPQKRDRPDQHVTGRRGGVYLSVCLTTLNLHPRPTTAYAALHSDDCYFGIMSICTVLNWGAVKSRLNTALSCHAILAGVSVAERVQIWSRAMEMSDTRCSLTSWLVSFFFFFNVLILFLPTLLNPPPLSQPLKHANPHTASPKLQRTLSYLPLVESSHAALVLLVLRYPSLRFLPPFWYWCWWIELYLWCSQEIIDHIKLST